MFITGVNEKQRIIGLIKVELKISKMNKLVIMGVCKSLRNDFIIGSYVMR